MVSKPNRLTSLALPRVTKHFTVCFDGLMEKFDDFGELELHHDEKAGGDNGSGSERQFGYCMDADPVRIAFASKAEGLPDVNLAGLMAHEFGHALEYRYGVPELERRLRTKLPKTVERRADVIAEKVFGRRIKYDDRDIQCVGCGGKSKRPTYLAKNVASDEELRLIVDVRGAHHDQVDVTIYAVKNKKYAGRLDYAEYRGCFHIQWIEVAVEFRKIGVGRELIKRLVQDSGGYENVDWGMLTPDGVALKKKMDAEFGEPEITCSERRTRDLTPVAEEPDEYDTTPYAEWKAARVAAGLDEEPE